MIDPEIFARYAALRVPRYTSYPTAPNFSATDDDGCYRRWLGALGSEAPISLYIHIPFCREMCWYCGCHTTVAHRRSPIARYVDFLEKEIRLLRSAIPEKLVVRHVHWGGGSPTLLSPGSIHRLNRQLRDCFKIAADAEIAIEVDPRTLTASCARAFVDAGVNRASIGVQSFDPIVQAAINRKQSFGQTATAVEMLRGLGVRGINLDLVYGLPHQTADSCTDTVREALLLDPDRLAVFGYAHVPAMKPHQRSIDEAALPDARQRLEQATAIKDELASGGYEPIGLDHFALPEDSLALAAREGALRRNFQGYTTDPCPTLIGLGASAISRLPDGFGQNAIRIPNYYRPLSSGRLPTARLCPVTAEDSHRADIIEQLMCAYRADIGSLVPPADLARLEDEGLIRRTGTLIEIPEDARPLVRAVAAAFDAYLPQATARHVTAI